MALRLFAETSPNLSTPVAGPSVRVKTRAAVGRILFLPLLLAWGLALAGKAAPQVKLVFPVRDGLEFAKVRRLVVDARVYEEDRQVFVMVGAYEDARVAYRMGATLQQQLGIPFELHYDAGHPQSDLSWTETLDRSPVTTVAPPSNANPVSLGQSQPPLANQPSPQQRAEPDQSRSLQEQTAAERRERNVTTTRQDQASNTSEQDPGPPRSQRVDPPRPTQQQPQPSQAAAIAPAPACATPPVAEGMAPAGSNRLASSTTAGGEAAGCPPDGSPPLNPTPVAASSVPPP